MAKAQNDSDTGFGFWSNPKTLLGLIALWFVIFLIFRFVPQLDLAIANFFYDPAICEGKKRNCLGFPWGRSEWLNVVRDVLHDSPQYIGTALLLFIGVQIWRGKRWPDKELLNQIVVLATLLLGPLLIVNAFFKEAFGRVRPRHVEDFGGQFDFTVVGQIAGQCEGNCSFVSGEGSIGGWFLVCGLLFAPHLRPLAYVILGTLGATMAMLRVTFGAHFMSDVMLGYLIPPIICAILAILITQVQKRASNSAR